MRKWVRNKLLQDFLTHLEQTKLFTDSESSEHICCGEVLCQPKGCLILQWWDLVRLGELKHISVGRFSLGMRLFQVSTIWSIDAIEHVLHCLWMRNIIEVNRQWFSIQSSNKTCDALLIFCLDLLVKTCTHCCQHETVRREGLAANGQGNIAELAPVK